MIDGKRVLALVPARSGSKGLPQKNIRLLHGKPLMAWPIETARHSNYIDKVVVSTDSEAFGNVAREYGADVPFIRPLELATDKSPSIDSILHALNTLKGMGQIFEYLVLLEPTSPLTETIDVDSALEMLVMQRTNADAIVSVAACQGVHPDFVVRIADHGLMQPYAKKHFSALPRRQEVELVYHLDGSLYISSTEALYREKSFCHDRTLSYIMPYYKSFEVDDRIDFICIEAILENQKQKKRDEVVT